MLLQRILDGEVSAACGAGMPPSSYQSLFCDVDKDTYFSTILVTTNPDIVPHINLKSS